MLFVFILLTLPDYQQTAQLTKSSVKRTFAIRFRYLLMNAVALRPVSGSF